MAQLSKQVIGQDAVVRGLVLALLCEGHVLVEGPPGTGKTRAVKSLARSLNASFGRIQFTPDLLPSDLTGNEVYTESRELIFQPGPVFNAIVLADEINRAPARVQSALLEAMEERQVTVGGQTYPLPAPFLVMATQNSLDQEGTYPLPEAQLDRFLMKLDIDYPDREADLAILDLQHKEESGLSPFDLTLTLDQVAEAQSEISKINVSKAIAGYIVDLVQATRHPERYGEDLQRWIRRGSSARATLALHRTARASAWLEGRDYVTPDDVRSVLVPCLSHRIHLSYDAVVASVSASEVIDALAQHVTAL
ncbi:MAG: MoxR family ATPase [Proteobacteria bacterium]|nr:MoxR family ATPase [Pseudomonadota bacterium]